MKFLPITILFLWLLSFGIMLVMFLDASWSSEEGCIEDFRNGAPLSNYCRDLCA
jgi:hypothetical protein